MTFRIAQISDTHLSGEKPFFVANFECIARAVGAAAPDLIVNSGDFSLDGTSYQGDLESAAHLHRGLKQPVREITISATAPTFPMRTGLPSTWRGARHTDVTSGRIGGVWMCRAGG